jgi:3-oxoadipate enol-lactonase
MAHVSRLEIDGTRIAFRVDGPADGSPLVLGHALGTSMRMWEPQLPALAERFRVIRYDTRGHGASDVSTAPVTIERLGRDMIALLDHLGVARAHLGGLSAGGITALWVAVHEPARLDRLVLANTAARIGSPEVWDERIATVRAGGMRAMRDASVGRFLTAPFREAHPEIACEIGEIIEGTPVEGYVALAEALSAADLRGELSRVAAPTLVVGGEHDPSTPFEQSRELHAGIAGSELVMLEDAAHLSNVEKPEEFTAALLRFLG